MLCLGVPLIAFGICYLIYSIIFRNKITLYYKGIKIIEGKEEKYLNLQLFFSIFNSLLMMIIGFIIVMNNLNDVYFLLTPLLFHLVNRLMKLISKQKGYIKLS